MTSTNPLQIGGDSIYGQFFQGTIDEVRVYNVALTAAQIQADMNTPIARTRYPDGADQPDGDSGEREPDQSELDRVDGQRGGDGYLVERQDRCNGKLSRKSGRTTGTTVQRHDGVGGQHTTAYRVRATDAAGDLSPYSNVRQRLRPGFRSARAWRR